LISLKLNTRGASYFFVAISLSNESLTFEVKQRCTPPYCGGFLSFS